jgi:hypothetical protein
MKWFMPAAAFAVANLFAGEAWSCACCSEPGERRAEPVAIDDYVAEQLGEITVAGPATLYTTVCGYDCVKGIDDPADSYAVKLSRTGGQWRFTFRGNAARQSGMLSFQFPATVFTFAVDPTPGTGTTSPALYKEWRLAAPVAGTGVFAAGMTGNPSATFILHGAGNSCDQPEDFTNWSLVVTGPGAEFTFFGSLRQQP